jgi:RNA polymerase sigma-70 factor (ECF subfamily)
VAPGAVTDGLLRGYHPPAMTDEQLVRRAREGDGRAFTALVDRHAPVCLRYATRMLGSVEDAEDVTQDSLYRAYRALASYEESTAFRTWLMAILINRCRSTLLYRSRREARVRVDDARVMSASVDSGVDAMVDRQTIEAALARLDPDLREAFLLKHVEQLTYDEMAEATGVGVSALKMRVKRACDQLREALEEDHVA